MVGIGVRVGDPPGSFEGATTVTIGTVSSGAVSSSSSSWVVLT